MTAKATTQTAIQYAQDVVDGTIRANKYIILQCQAFLNDLNSPDDDFRWTFSPDLADHALAFMQLFKHVEGVVAGKPIVLSPWQAFIIINAFGWVDKLDTSVRRYTSLVCLVGRKNAKSTLLAVWALYELRYAPDGSQIVTMATQKDQAKLVWNLSGRMAETSDSRLIPSFDRTISAISNKDKWTRYWPLSKESKRLDGLNIRLAIADEAAAIANADLFDVVTSSMGSQVSPQIVYITTGQTGAESNQFAQVLDYGKKVLDGIVADDRIFTLAYQLEEGDDWKDPSVWIKANPNMDISVKMSFLLEEMNQALSIPSKAINFKVKYCNMFLSSAEAWMDVALWHRGTSPKAPDPASVPMYVGLDMGATSDLTAVSKLWAKDGQFFVDFQAWIPEDAFKNAPRHVRATYDQAAESGVLRVTEGDVSDHDAVYDYLISLAETEDVQEIAFDSWSAIHLTSRLQDVGLPMVRMDQSMRALSPASKEVEMLVMGGSIKHLGHPFIAWCFDNCEVYTDANGNIKVRKGADAALKIDPIVAMIMAVGRATVFGAQDKPAEATFFFG